MYNIHKDLKFPERIDLLVKNQIPGKFDETNVTFIFESFERLLVILDEDTFEKTYPDKNFRVKYLNDCYYINYFSISYLLKYSRFTYEQEMIDKQNMISHSKNKEIENIKYFLYDELIDDSIKAISKILNRSLVHLISLFPEDNEDFNSGLELSMNIDTSKDVDHSNTRNEIHKIIIDNDIALDINDTKDYLKYYNTATSINDKKYLSLYKPLFESLHEYLNYLEDNEKEKETNEHSYNTNFIVLEEDFRDKKSGSLSYDDIKEPNRFKYIEEILFEDSIIDSNYNFLEKKGNKKTLAIITRFMINEKYFRPNNFKHRANFKDYHYRQYLDNRYNVDTSQQFKRIKDDEVKHFFEGKQWKYNLKKLINTDHLSINSW